MSRDRLPGLPVEAERALLAKLETHSRRIAALEGPQPVQPPLITADFDAREWQTLFLSAGASGIRGLLPAPRPQNRGATIRLVLTNNNPVRLSCPGGLVNGVPVLTHDLAGAYEAVCDGSAGWWLESLDVDVTDIVDNVSITEAAPNKIQRAALTGEVTAPAGLNATTITRTTNFAWTGNHDFAGGCKADELMLDEQATSPTVAAGVGMLWVRNDTPNVPMFTGDTNVDCPIQNGLAEQLTAASVSAATTVLSTTQTYNIPANTLRVGSRFRCCYTYRFVRGATATALNLSSFFDVATHPSVGPASSVVAGTYIVRVWGEFTVLSTGAGGTAMGSIMAHAASAAGVAGFGPGYTVGNDSTSFPLDTTVPIAMRGAVAMSGAVAGTSITATGGHIEWIR